MYICIHRIHRGVSGADFLTMIFCISSMSSGDVLVEGAMMWLYRGLMVDGPIVWFDLTRKTVEVFRGHGPLFCHLFQI